MLDRILEITHDILQARDLEPAVESIARGFMEVFGWKYVTIVATDEPGGPMVRRVLLGYPPEIVDQRRGERIPYDEIGEALRPECAVFPNCFHVPAEAANDTDHNLYTGDLPRNAPRGGVDHWHERDMLVLVLADRDGRMLGYLSPDHPNNGLVPTLETLREMQIFVNLLGLALTNAQAQRAETARNRLLEENARLQNHFFSMVSHEVRSPLAAIRGATSLLSEHFDQLEAERREELLGVLDSSTTRLGSIFEDFLLLSRMEAGQLTLRMRAVDPVSSIQESVARAESEHPEREFQSSFIPPLPLVHADEGRVVQVLANFLSNAVKYSSDDTPVKVEAKACDGHVRFSVTNVGPGIPEEHREKLFTRFGRLSHGDESTGLGLFISKQLVDLMEGQIGFESEPGQETTFWLALPRFDEGEAQYT